MAVASPSVTFADVNTPLNVKSQTQQQQQQQQKPFKLPSPQTFDILPPLHELLARIEHSSSSSTGVNSANPPGAGTSVAPDPVSVAETGAAYVDQQPLDPKDLPNEILPIKGRIRRVLKELEELPDMDRTVEEQREEIEELEARIHAQRKMLMRLGERAAVLSGQV